METDVPGTQAPGPNGSADAAAAGAASTARGAAAELLAGVAEERRGLARQWAALAELAAVYDPGQCPQLPGRPRCVQAGDEGTPRVNELIGLEVAGLLQVSPDQAWVRVRDALNLRYRHPQLAAAVAELRIESWQARRIMTACAHLTADAAAAVDARLASALGVLAWPRLRRRLAGLIVQADRATAQERAEQARAQRFCRVRHNGDGTSWLTALLDTAVAVRLEDVIDTLARARLADPGYPGSPDQARADAVADLVTPTSATADAAGFAAGAGLVGGGTATLVVHLHADTLDDWTDDPEALESDGVGRPEGPGRADIGPLLEDQVRVLLGHRRVTVLPVVDLNDDPAVDSYEIPAHLQRHVRLRDGWSVFPYATTPAAACDEDHTRRYRWDGTPGQTRPANLGCLHRRAHRAKTHTQWRVEQPRPGLFEWTTPLGYQYWVDRTGTHLSPERAAALTRAECLGWVHD